MTVRWPVCRDTRARAAKPSGGNAAPNPGQPPHLDCLCIPARRLSRGLPFASLPYRRLTTTEIMAPGASSRISVKDACRKEAMVIDTAAVADLVSQVRLTRRRARRRRATDCFRHAIRAPVRRRVMRAAQPSRIASVDHVNCSSPATHAEESSRHCSLASCRETRCFSGACNP